jgi:hypothetical protein
MTQRQKFNLMMGALILSIYGLVRGIMWLM